MGRTLRIAVMLGVAVSMTIPQSGESAAPPSLLMFAVDSGSKSVDRGLCLTRSNGTRQLHLTRGDDSEPAWSPDGGRVAFTRDVSGSSGGGETDVFVADARGRVLRNVSNRLAVFSSDPSWSPDGRRLVYAGAWRGSTLLIADLRTGRLRELPVDNAGNPAWSPDGRWIAFESWTDLYGRPPEGNGIYAIRPDGTGQHLLVPNAVDPAWSPDGRRIAYTHSRGGVTDVVVANADGSDARVITDFAAQPAWSPNGRLLAFTKKTLADESYGIIVTDADGSNPRAAAIAEPISSYDSGRVTDPAWRPAAALPGRKYPRCWR